MYIFLVQLEVNRLTETQTFNFFNYIFYNIPFVSLLFIFKLTYTPFKFGYISTWSQVTNGYVEKGCPCSNLYHT